MWNSSEEFAKASLDGKPREWVVVLAARSALRVLPLLTRLSETRGGVSGIKRKRIILPLFRATALTWAAARYPAQSKAISASASTAGGDRLSPAVAAATAASATTAVANAAAFAASTAYATTDSASTAYAIAAANAAANAANADAADAASAWQALLLDKSILERTKNVTILARMPLWVPQSADGSALSQVQAVPDWIVGPWTELKRSLLRAKDEDWQVWIDWYEARFDGRDPWPEEVEVACALIPDEIWKQGPAAVNAEIRRIREGGASKPAPDADPVASAETLPDEPSANPELLARFVEAVSPKPFLTEDNKLDAGRNPEFDLALSSQDLPTLPVRQQALIRTILRDYGANAPRIVKAAFEEYRDELNARGLQPILGLLNDMASIIAAECAAKNAAAEWLGEGARETVDRFLANHELLAKHFPLDAEREALMAQIAVDEDAAVGKALSQPFEDVAQAAKEAHANGLTTDAYLKIVDKLTEFAKVLATQPPEASAIEPRPPSAGRSVGGDNGAPPIIVAPEDRPSHPQQPASSKKRLILGAFGLLVGSVHLLSSIVTVTGSGNALAFVEKLEAAVKEFGRFLGVP